MPKVTIDIPAKFMPEILELVAVELPKLDTSGMTNADIAQKYIVKLVRERVRTSKDTKAEIEARVVIMDSVNTLQAAAEATKLANATVVDEIR